MASNQVVTSARDGERSLGPVANLFAWIGQTSTRWLARPYALGTRRWGRTSPTRNGGDTVASRPIFSSFRSAILVAALTFAAPASLLVERVPDPSVDQMLAKLRYASTASEAARLANAVRVIWANSGEEEIVMPLFASAVTALHAGDYARAEELFDVVVLAQPGFAEAWNRRGVARYNQGKLRAAMEDVRQTLTLEPRNFDAMHGMGLMAMGLGQLPTAERYLRLSLESNPWNLDALQTLQAIIQLRDSRDI